MKRKGNREGNMRQLPDGTWECVIQSKYLNSKTNTPKRVKRREKTEKDAMKNLILLVQVTKVISMQCKPIFTTIRLANFNCTNQPEWLEELEIPSTARAAVVYYYLCERANKEGEC